MELTDLEQCDSPLLRGYARGARELNFDWREGLRKAAMIPEIREELEKQAFIGAALKGLGAIAGKAAPLAGRIGGAIKGGVGTAFNAAKGMLPSFGRAAAGSADDVARAAAPAAQAAGQGARAIIPRPSLAAQPVSGMPDGLREIGARVLPKSPFSGGAAAPAGAAGGGGAGVFPKAWSWVKANPGQAAWNASGTLAGGASAYAASEGDPLATAVGAATGKYTGPVQGGLMYGPLIGQGRQLAGAAYDAATGKPTAPSAPAAAAQPNLPAYQPGTIGAPQGSQAQFFGLPVPANHDEFSAWVQNPENKTAFTSQLGQAEQQLVQSAQGGKVDQSHLNSVIHGGLMLSSAEQGIAPHELATKAQQVAQQIGQDGQIDPGEFQGLLQTTAGQKSLSELMSQEGTTDPQSALGIFHQMLSSNPMQAAALVMGIPLMLHGLLTGNIMSGLLGAAGLAHGAGMFGGNNMMGQLMGATSLAGTRGPMQPAQITAPPPEGQAPQTALDWAAANPEAAHQQLLAQHPMIGLTSQFATPQTMQQFLQTYRQNPQQAVAAFPPQYHDAIHGYLSGPPPQ